MKGKGKGALILAFAKDKGMSGGTKGEPPDEKKSLAREMMDAIKNDDPSTFADAMRDFIECCGEAGGESEDGGGEEAVEQE